jgi:hypothetical protein
MPSQLPGPSFQTSHAGNTRTFYILEGQDVFTHAHREKHDP